MMLFNAGQHGAGLPIFFSLISLFVLWSLVWKGLALWHAAQTGKTWWFVAILLLNTFGLLEIFYLFAIEKKQLKTLFTGARHHKKTDH